MIGCVPLQFLATCACARKYINGIGFTMYSSTNLNDTAFKLTGCIDRNWKNRSLRLCFPFSISLRIRQSFDGDFGFPAMHFKRGACSLCIPGKFQRCVYHRKIICIRFVRRQNRKLFIILGGWCRLQHFSKRPLGTSNDRAWILTTVAPLMFCAWWAESP